MKQISLNHGKIAEVCNCHYELVAGYKWFVVKGHNTYYVQTRVINPDGKPVILHMHRIIAGTPQGVETDHKDLNGLNNQCSNLRPVTNSRNQQNRGLRCNNISGFKGVSWRKDIGKWLAQIYVSKKRITLGYFKDPAIAGIEYDKAAVKYFGEYARTNQMIQADKEINNA